MIQSRLTVTGMLARFAFFALITGMLYCPTLLIKDKTALLEWCFSILVIIIIFVMSLMVLLTTRNISVDVDKITYTNWLTGKARSYYFKDLDGYVTTIKPGRIIGSLYEEFESVLLVKENKRIGEISSYRYSNYNELIGGLKDLKNLGRVDNNTFNSFKDYFNELIK